MLGREFQAVQTLGGDEVPHCTRRGAAVHPQLARGQQLGPVAFFHHQVDGEGQVGEERKLVSEDGRAPAGAGVWGGDDDGEKLGVSDGSRVCLRGAVIITHHRLDGGEHYTVGGIARGVLGGGVMGDDPRHGGLHPTQKEHKPPPTARMSPTHVDRQPRHVLSPDARGGEGFQPLGVEIPPHVDDDGQLQLGAGCVVEHVHQAGDFSLAGVGGGEQAGLADLGEHGHPLKGHLGGESGRGEGAPKTEGGGEVDDLASD